MTEATNATEATPENDWPNWAPTFLDRLRKVPNISQAAKAAGISRSAAHRLTQRDEAFALAVHDARETALDLLEETIYAIGTSGLPVTKTVTKRDPQGNVLETTETEELVRSPTLAMFYLKRWRPEYRESFRVEQTGPKGGPIQHEVTVVAEAAAEARAELERIHD